MTSLIAIGAGVAVLTGIGALWSWGTSRPEIL